MTQYLDILKEKYKLFPSELQEKERRIGIELEFHIVPKDGSKPDFNKLKNILNELLPILDFEKTEFDFDGNCIKGSNGEDLISYESGYGMIELSLCPTLDIHSTAKNASNLIKKINVFLDKQGLTLLPSGLNPFPWVLEIPLLKNTKRKILGYIYDQFNLKDEYSYPNTAAFICSSQVHLDLSHTELPIFLNIANKLGWIKALLFSNSPKILNNKEKCFCFRDILWEQLTDAYFKTNVGVRDKTFSNYEEVFLDTLENSIFYVQRDNQTVFFRPYKLKDFLEEKTISGWKIDNSGLTHVKIHPQKSDVYFSRPCNAAIITYRGTVEIRSECQQPFSDLMSPVAFHLGILNNMDRISEHLKTIEKIYEKYSFSQLRKKAIMKNYDIQNELDFNLQEFILRLLFLIKEGLIKRKLGEEVYLECLFKRVKLKSNPANDWFKSKNYE